MCILGGRCVHGIGIGSQTHFTLSSHIVAFGCISKDYSDISIPGSLFHAYFIYNKTISMNHVFLINIQNELIINLLTNLYMHTNLQNNIKARILNNNIMHTFFLYSPMKIINFFYNEKQIWQKQKNIHLL